MEGVPDNVMNYAVPMNTGAPTYAPAQKSSGDMYSTLITAVIVLLVILIIIYLAMPRSLSKRLECKGWVVYFMQGCHYCSKQKRVLDRDFRKYIECDANGNQIGGINPPVPCGSPIITGYPFWFNTRTGESKPGFQSLLDLEIMSA
jgi:hypothetical protein